MKESLKTFIIISVSAVPLWLFLLPGDSELKSEEVIFP